MGLTRSVLTIRSHALEPALGFATVALAYASTSFPALVIGAAAAAGAMARDRAFPVTMATCVALIALLAVLGEQAITPGLVVVTVLTAITALPATRRLHVILPHSTISFALLLVLAASCLAAAAQWPSRTAPLLAVACLFCAFLGAGLAHRLETERLRTWTDHNVVDFTRELLLGRVTSGMLHDLAQPLNVISMANGNLEYLLDRLDIDPTMKTLLHERSLRITEQTGQAAQLLGLFRWFGRNAMRKDGTLTVRDAIEHAVTATKSNIRHAGVEVELRGDALDCLLPARHASLEMLVAAALLSSFEMFLGKDGAKLPGSVIVQASLAKASIVISVHCLDQEGMPRRGTRMDTPTTWLINQVAHESNGQFRHDLRPDQPVRFSIVIDSD